MSQLHSESPRVSTAMSRFGWSTRTDETTDCASADKSVTDRCTGISAVFSLTDVKKAGGDAIQSRRTTHCTLDILDAFGRECPPGATRGARS